MAIRNPDNAIVPNDVVVPLIMEDFNTFTELLIVSFL